MMKKLIVLIAMIFCTTKVGAQSNLQMCLTDDFGVVKQENKKSNNSEFRTTQQELVSEQKTWPIGAKIIVKFVDKPSAKVFSKIKKYAEEWEQYANINFVFKPYDYNTGVPGTIRIGLVDGKGSWSAVGIDALKKGPFRRTMNFGWFNDSTSEKEFRRTTLHEFGHALGLNHEHKSPSKNICWNWPKVIDAYKRSQDWDEERTPHNLERLSNEDVGNYSAFDPNSIMVYAINNNLTTCDFEVEGNEVLSYHDRQGIANLYPKAKNRSIRGDWLYEYKWTSGWDNVETFENKGKTFLFLLKSKTGDVHIHRLQNSSVGAKVYDKKWTKGWTTARIFKISLQSYLLLLKKVTGDVKIFKLNDNGTIGSKVFEKKWTMGWTNAQFYKQGSGLPYLFLIKEGTGDVHINKINRDGTVGAKTFDKRWTSGWSIGEVFQTNFQKHLFLMKASTGDVHIYKLNSNGTVGTKVYDKKWSTGWTSASFYGKNNQQHLMLLNAKNGRAKQWYVTAGGTIGGTIADEQWTTGWTSNEFYRSGSNAFMFLLKEKDGIVKTFLLK